MVNETARTETPLMAVRQLAGILLASLTALAETGEIEAACRLARQPCVSLRATDPAMARRFDVLLHRLTPARSSKNGLPIARGQKEVA